MQRVTENPIKRRKRREKRKRVRLTALVDVAILVDTLIDGLLFAEVILIRLAVSTRTGADATFKRPSA